MTDRAQLPIALTLGDPAGCGPQITGKAWTALRDNPNMAFAVIGPIGAFSDWAPAQKIENLAQASAVFSDALPVLDITPDQTGIVPGQPDTANAPLILTSIEMATGLALQQKASAVVTNPINKAVLYEAGFKHPGHTEFLAALCAEQGPAPKPIMMLVGGGLRVALATIHMPLIEAARSLSIEGLMEIATITDTALKRDFGIRQPRLVFTGLNPHAGEAGTIGREEIEIINPAARMLRDKGIDMQDARPADTVFAEALEGRFDAVIAMTHDQGLIPVKTLDFWGGVNVTLGLPIIRTSPDHGTAYEAAAAGTCRADSLIAAIQLAAKNASMRANG